MTVALAIAIAVEVLLEIAVATAIGPLARHSWRFAGERASRSSNQESSPGKTPNQVN